MFPFAFEATIGLAAVMLIAGAYIVWFRIGKKAEPE